MWFYSLTQVKRMLLGWVFCCCSSYSNRIRPAQKQLKFPFEEKLCSYLSLHWYNLATQFFQQLKDGRMQIHLICQGRDISSPFARYPLAKFFHPYTCLQSCQQQYLYMYRYTGHTYTQIFVLNILSCCLLSLFSYLWYISIISLFCFFVLFRSKSSLLL